MKVFKGCRMLLIVNFTALVEVEISHKTNNCHVNVNCVWVSRMDKL